MCVCVCGRGGGRTQREVWALGLYNHTTIEDSKARLFPLELLFVCQTKKRIIEDQSMLQAIVRKKRKKKDEKLVQAYFGGFNK